MNRSAIICPIKNETTYIQKFLEYYRRHFDGNDIYILNFGSDEDYLQEYIRGKAMIIDTDLDILDADGVFFELKHCVKFLKTQGYDYVIPLDVDEFIVYNGKGGLKEYLKNLDRDFVTCRGYEVIHVPGLQEPFDHSKKWIDQIDYWYEEPVHYNKTLISKFDLDWVIGFHVFRINGELINTSANVDPNLFLIHLHKHDYETTINRHFEVSKMKWSKKTIDRDYNKHYRIKDISKIKEWYFDSIFGNKIYKIPEQIKKNIDI